MNWRLLRFVLAGSCAVLAITFNNCSGFEQLDEAAQQAYTASRSQELPQLTIFSSIDQSAAPFTVGHVFRKGDIPLGQSVQVIGANAQVIPKNFWSDGSLRFAIISGSVSTSANLPVKLSFSKGAASPGAAIPVSELKASGTTVTIAAGNFGSAIWTSTDWDQVFKIWIAGPLMSSFIYRKQIGIDPHLVAWLEVRVYAGREIEILPWIENGYLNVQGPTTKSAAYTFSLNGQMKFNSSIDLPHHTRTPLISGKELSYWVGSDPQIIPRHDVKYLQSTEVVPTYGAVVEPARASGLPASYVPLQQGSFTYDADAMPSSGFQRPIGLLPTHDVFYLVCDNPRPVYESVIRNGYSAGRYPIHYRDEKTNSPLKFSSYPNLVINDSCGFKDNGASSKSQITPACSGVGTRSWDTAHSPSVGYMAYILTGRWYFMEEVQFAATVNYLGLSDTSIMRNGSDGILHPVTGAFQTRASAWAVRSLVQALSVTPDDESSLRNEFRSSWQANIDFHYNRYIAQPHNPFGFITPGGVYSDGGLSVLAPWMEDFVTAAWGYAIALDLPVSSEYAKKTSAFFQWKAKSVVGRLGLANEFWYVNADPYNIAVSPVKMPDWVTGKGPWYSSWKEVYNATYAAPPSWLSSKEGQLAGEYGIDSWANAMWGNLQPAIAYSVRYNVPGARAAYDRMIHADNWPTLAGYFNLSPVWGVVPNNEK